MSDVAENDHLSCIGEPARLGDGPALYMRPEDPGGTIRFWPSGEIAEVEHEGTLIIGQRIKGTPYEVYMRVDDPAGTLRLRRAPVRLQDYDGPDERLRAIAENPRKLANLHDNSPDYDRGWRP